MANRYNHRLRNAILASGNPWLFSELNIPRSTIRDWMRKGPVEVVTSSDFNKSTEELARRVEKLSVEVEQAHARAKLVIVSMKILGFQIQFSHVRDILFSNINSIVLKTSKNSPVFTY